MGHKAKRPLPVPSSAVIDVDSDDVQVAPQKKIKTPDNVVDLVSDDEGEDITRGSSSSSSSSNNSNSNSNSSKREMIVIDDDDEDEARDEEDEAELNAAINTAIQRSLDHH